jgi:hypothetical protein
MDTIQVSVSPPTNVTRGLHHAYRYHVSDATTIGVLNVLPILHRSCPMQAGWYLVVCSWRERESHWYPKIVPRTEQHLDIGTHLSVTVRYGHTANMSRTRVA